MVLPGHAVEDNGGGVRAREIDLAVDAVEEEHGERGQADALYLDKGVYPMHPLHQLFDQLHADVQDEGDDAAEYAESEEHPLDVILNQIDINRQLLHFGVVPILLWRVARIVLLSEVLILHPCRWPFVEERKPQGGVHECLEHGGGEDRVHDHDVLAV